jgi:hypothetical protein
MSSHIAEMPDIKSMLVYIDLASAVNRRAESGSLSSLSSLINEYESLR